MRESRSTSYLKWRLQWQWSSGLALQTSLSKISFNVGKLLSGRPITRIIIPSWKASEHLWLVTTFHLGKTLKHITYAWYTNSPLFLNSIALAMRKPTHFKYSSNIAECCRLLTCISQAVSDKLLPCFVQLQKLAEEIDQLFQYSNEETLQNLDYIQINATMRNFRSKIDQLVQQFPPEAKENSAHPQTSLSMVHTKT